jgi:hypothetical protein
MRINLIIVRHFVNPICELLQNASSTYQLERRYYWLTTCVGLLGVTVGTGLLFASAKALSAVFGVSIAAPIRSDPNGVVLFVVFLISIPAAIYVGAVVVAGVFAFIMVRLGRFTSAEALGYALLSRYPESWLKGAKRA